MRISLVRHGQSRANVGQHDYKSAGDHAITLTAHGMFQARAAGQLLRESLHPAPPHSTLIYCSPYTRTRQTLEHMFTGEFPHNVIGYLASGPRERARVFEDPRLRETDHGYSDVDEQQELRNIHGWFYYRYKGGESPADCSDRMSSFLESMMRQVQRKNPDEVVIVTHGLAIRCFVMRFLHLTVEQFESMANPNNCDIITIDRKELLENPVFTSGRWGVEGIKLREPAPIAQVG